MTTSRDSRGFGELVTELARSGADLIRSEVKLARLELAAIASNAGRGAAFVTIGALMLLFGGLSFVAGVVLVAGDQWVPRDSYWFAALLFLILAAIAAFTMTKRAMRQLSPDSLVPDETIATLKEDKEWLTRQLTSAATSS